MKAIATLAALAALCPSTAWAVPAGTLEMELTRIINQSSYAVEMEIGTPPQKQMVIIDTGSPFMGLAGTKSNWCELPKKPCKYGSYDNTTSSTAKYISNEFNNALINHGYGDYIRDVVRTGGQTFSRIIFGMILTYGATFPAPAQISGLVGLAPFCLGKNHSCTTPTTFQQRLIQRGFLKKNFLSVYLGPEEPTAKGQLLFGAVDRAKQLDTPVTFPVISPGNPIANSSPNVANYSSITLTTISGTSPSTDLVKTTAFNISKNSFGILDTGAPHWYMAAPVWNYASKYLQLHNENTDIGYWEVDCKFRQPQKDGATLHIGFANDAIKIAVPMERLVTQLAPGKCVSYIENCGADGEGCSFGDPFLRSAYISFDFDNLTVSLSNAKYTNQTNIVEA